VTDAYYADYELTGRPHLTEPQRQVLQSVDRERAIESVCRLLSAGKVSAGVVCERYNDLMGEVGDRVVAATTQEERDTGHRQATG
jgi:hypothetical protein